MRKLLTKGTGYSVLMMASSVIGASVAGAAPQILGLAMTDGAVPLQCANGACSAELTAICLQETRPVPATGTAYRPLKGTRITLVLHRPDGSTVEAAVGSPAAGQARLEAWRTHTAVRLSVSRAVLARHGAVSASVRVAGLSTVAPVARAGDPRPQTRADLARARGVLRLRAAALIDRDTANGVAVRVVNRMINRLAAGNGADGAFRARLWREEIARAGRRSPSVAGAGLKYVRRWQKICRGYAEKAGHFRACLESAHDSLIGVTNQEFWRMEGADS